MGALPLHPFHERHGALFGQLGGEEVVQSYSSPEQEYLHLTQTAALLDLSFRGRLCLLGPDREKFLHGQVTNDVAGLKTGEGCYAAIVDGKARLQSDLFIYKLADEILLDFEPGLTQRITDRLDKYIIAEDVQVVDVSPHYGLLSLQGPQSETVLQDLGWFPAPPPQHLAWVKAQIPKVGETYLMRNARLRTTGFDLFIPTEALETAASLLSAAVRKVSGGLAGSSAFDIARIEAGVPQFGIDMDEHNLAPEAMRTNAISYSKGCYIGQEIIARIRTYGSVAKALRLLQLPAELNQLPVPGEKLFTSEGKDAGYITSSTLSPKSGGKIALGYVRREANAPGAMLRLGSPEGGIVSVLKAPGE